MLKLKVNNDYFIEVAPVNVSLKNGIITNVFQSFCDKMKEVVFEDGTISCEEFAGWRLPTTNELSAINRAIHDDVVKNIEAGYYWNNIGELILIKNNPNKSTQKKFFFSNALKDFMKGFNEGYYGKQNDNNSDSETHSLEIISRTNSKELFGHARLVRNYNPNSLHCSPEWFHISSGNGRFIVRSEIDKSASSFQNCDMRNVSFKNIILKNSNFKNANLAGADFTLADLEGCDFSDANLKNSIFSHTNLKNACFNNSDLTNANFNSRHGNIDKFDSNKMPCFSYNRMSKDVKNNFLNTVFNNTSAKGVEIEWVNFHNLEKINIILNGSIIKHSRFSNSEFMNSEFMNCKFEHVKFLESELQNANFYHSHFESCYFSNSKLDLSDFSFCTFHNCIFLNSSLVNANFSNSFLNDSNFTKANLSGANFFNTSHSEIIINGANTDNIFGL